MKRCGKRLKNIYATFDRTKVYKVEEAVSLLKSFSKVKFDEAVEVAISLNVDPKKSDQGVRGVVSLPHGTGKTYKVAVFARGDKAREAEEAGADIVGAEDLAERVQKGEIPFTKCIATPDMMSVVGKVGKILGPKGLMPNPRLGTVTFDVASAIQAVRRGQVELRAEKAGIVHSSVGKVSFSVNGIVENIKALIDAALKLKPASVKGVYLKAMSVSSTMGPGIKFVL